MRKIFLTLLLAALPLLASADEGMWLVNMIEGKLHRQMADAGLRLDAKTIYDEDRASLSDAVVALAFSCTGSMISNDGLMITNHHCAYEDVHKLSTPEHNYLEDGFWALSRDKELPVHSEGIYFLKKVLDVTEEVQHLKDSTHAEGKVFGMRKVYAMIEERYAKMFEGQGEVICSSFWGGQKYMVAHYQVYKDVRLVAAPPVCIASYGAEVDNWEWPQHKGDSQSTASTQRLTALLPSTLPTMCRCIPRRPSALPRAASARATIRWSSAIRAASTAIPLPSR